MVTDRTGLQVKAESLAWIGPVGLSASVGLRRTSQVIHSTIDCLFRIPVRREVVSTLSDGVESKVSACKERHDVVPPRGVVGLPDSPLRKPHGRVGCGGARRVAATRTELIIWRT